MESATSSNGNNEQPYFPLLLITGASGFLGQYVVAEALRCNYRVRAMTRLKSQDLVFPWQDHDAVEWFQGDLTEPDTIQKALEGVTAVIHLAAVKMGDYQQQFLGTVKATENLLTAMRKADIKRLIAVSSFSVFDYLSPDSNTVIDEISALETCPQNRDLYAQMKLLQEQKIREFEQTDGGEITILRPGMIYGRSHWWNARLGIKLSNRFSITIGGKAIIPLIYVENCAQAIIVAVKEKAAIGQIFNLVDNDLPTQETYLKAITKYMTVTPSYLSISWGLIALIANLGWLINQHLFKGKIKLPGLLIPARLYARFKPFNYNNNNAKKVLNWNPRYSLDQSLERSFSSQNLLSVDQQVE